MGPSLVAREDEERDSYRKANGEIPNIAYKIPSDLGRRNAVTHYEYVLYERDLIVDIDRTTRKHMPSLYGPSASGNSVNDISRGGVHEPNR